SSRTTVVGNHGSRTATLKRKGLEDAFYHGASSLPRSITSRTEQTSYRAPKVPSLPGCYHVQPTIRRAAQAVARAHCAAQGGQGDMTQTTVRYGLADGVATITPDRPETRTTLNPPIPDHLVSPTPPPP